LTITKTFFFFYACQVAKPLNLSGFTQPTSEEKITLNAEISPTSGKGKQRKPDFEASKITPLKRE
jgi:hypothetical protein